MNAGPFTNGVEQLARVLLHYGVVWLVHASPALSELADHQTEEAELAFIDVEDTLNSRAQAPCVPLRGITVLVQGSEGPKEGEIERVVPEAFKVHLQ